MDTAKTHQPLRRSPLATSISLTLGASLLALLTACGTDAPLTATAPAATVPTANNAASPTTESGTPTIINPTNAPPANTEAYLAQPLRLPACYNPQNTVGETIDTHACSWSFNALKLQNLVTQRQAFVQSPFLATHNSFNSSAYPGLSSSGDPNHSLTLGDQLRLGMTGIELDVHWIFHGASQRFAPVLCHGVSASQGHVGCTPQDRLLADGLKEIRAFLDRPDSAGVVLLLDIENVLQMYVPPNGAEVSKEGHGEAAKLFGDILGDKLFKPAVAGQCNVIDPKTFSKQQVLDAGKQVVIIGGCGTGAAWQSAVFDMPRKQKANDGFDAATCENDFFSPADYRNTFTRIWHDSTRLSAVAIGGLKAIDATELAGMVKCGLHQPSLDLLTVGDNRLPVAIWSWDLAHPKTATSAQCTEMASNGRWRNADCSLAKSYACRTTDGWMLAPSTGQWATGRQVCEGAGLQFDLPRSAADNLRLDAARKAANVQSVWINWQDATGQGAFALPPPPK